jgi:hemolysin activation/secretion protein
MIALTARFVGKVPFAVRIFSEIRQSWIFFVFFYLLASLFSEDDDRLLNKKNIGLHSPVSIIQEEDDSNITFQVQNFRFKGLKAFPPKVLRSNLQAFRQVPLQFDDLSQIVSHLEEFYKKEGKIVSVKIPPQDITDGMLIIDLAEARVGKIIIDPVSSSHVKQSRIKGTVESYSSPKTIYGASRMNRGLLLADDLPGVSMTGFLQAGEADDEVDLVLKTSKESPYIADLVVDNAHSRSLGTYRATLAASLVSPFQLAETIGLQTLKSEGSNYGKLSLGMPFGYRGWRFNLYGSALTYKVVTNELAALKIKGEVEEAGLSLRYPIIRNQRGNLYQNFQFDHRVYLSSVASVTQKHYSIDSLSMNLSGNLFDTVLGGGANSMSIGLSQGKVSGLDGIPTNPHEGYHTLINYSASRQQTISEKLSFFLSVSGQLTQDVSTNSLHTIEATADEVTEDFLDSAESFSLGGLNGVRAYPSGEATGSVGRLVKAELRYLISNDIIAKTFYDWGWVGKRDPTTTGPSEYELSGGGVNFAWSAPLGFSMQTTYARRFGENPNPSPTGMDQDGSLEEDRFWVVLGRSF